MYEPRPLGLERSEAYPAAAVANLLQRRAKIPLLVSGDFERGTAIRIREGTSFPHAMAVAATGRAEDAYTMGRITALEARAIGAPLIFAPVADVNSDPRQSDHQYALVWRRPKTRGRAGRPRMCAAWRKTAGWRRPSISPATAIRASIPTWICRRCRAIARTWNASNCRRFARLFPPARAP